MERKDKIEDFDLKKKVEDLEKISAIWEKIFLPIVRRRIIIIICLLSLVLVVIYYKKTFTTESFLTLVGFPSAWVIALILNVFFIFSSYVQKDYTKAKKLLNNRIPKKQKKLRREMEKIGKIKEFLEKRKEKVREKINLFEYLKRLY